MRRGGLAQEKGYDEVSNWKWGNGRLGWGFGSVKLGIRSLGLICLWRWIG